MMSRKNYQEVAEIVNLLISIGYIQEGKESFVIGMFGEMFQRDNPRFERGRFVNACLENIKQS